MPADMNETFAEAEADVEAGRFGSVELPDAIRLLNELISNEMGRLTNLSDDPDKNEEQLRQHLFNIALKSFVAGLYTGSEGASAAQDGVVVVVPPQSLQDIGVAAIREGAVTFHLVAADESEAPR